MLDISRCHCENIISKGVTELRTSKHVYANKTYEELEYIYQSDKQGRQRLWQFIHLNNPGELRDGIYTRRISHPYGCLNEQFPGKVQVMDAKGVISSTNMGIIPTLTEEILPLRDARYQALACSLLQEEGVKTVYETSCLNTTAKNGFIAPLFSSAAHLLLEFDPLCGSCPMRREGHCIPEIMFSTVFKDLQNSAEGFVDIKRQLYQLTSDI